MLVVLAAVATGALAAPITFKFTFANGPATAVGSITFESTLLVNPGVNDFFLPNPAVLALNVTVSGASAGNGSFGIGSFNEVRFNTGGATLNLSSELVGQATPGGSWGTPTPCCGDFNLFGIAPPAPRGVFFFTLGANFGDAESMTLKSMTSSTLAPIPALDDAMLLLLALLVAAAGIVILRRRGSAGTAAT